MVRLNRNISDSVRGFFNPVFLRSKVVHGFNRGGKELGIPTANYPEDVVDNLPQSFDTGIYYGWACVDKGDVHKMVLSVGWNPFYKNKKKSMETHIMHDFEEDFYGSELTVIVLGYIRPEASFPSLESLVNAIHADIAAADKALELPENKLFQSHKFFSQAD